jgi:O-antigen ligase
VSINYSEKQKSTSKAISKILLPLAVLVPSFFWISGSDPFNAPKLLILGVGATALGIVSFVNLSKQHLKSHSLVIALSGLFVFALLNSFLFSDAPISTQIFGAYGRNTGLLNYLFLAFVLIATTYLVSKSEIKRVFFSIFWVAIFNLILFTLEVLGVNPQRVDRTYSRDLVGSFGNPNFVSAFMAIFGTVSMIVFIGSDKRRPISFLFLLGTFLAFLGILRSNSNQGLVILLAGIFMGLLFKVHFSVQSRFIRYIFYFSSVILSVIGIAGVLNQGPLARYLFENSVKFRWEYWKAGVKMFLDQPFHGVGLNSYGDWYRAARSPNSLETPGVDTVTNAAHNVFIDFAATGGIPLVVVYLAIVILGIRAFVRIIKSTSSFDYLPIGLFVGWICYLVQAAISIDQIGLGIYGWILPGLLIALSRLQKVPEDTLISTQRKSSNKNRNSEKELVSAKDLLATVAGLAIGFTLVFPVVRSDMNWLTALKSSDAETLKTAAMQWPRNENVVASFAKMLLANKLYSESIEIAQSGVKEFPRSFIAWQQIFDNPQAPLEIRQEALAKMMELDPLNPKIKLLTLP